ncbi:MAG: NAD-dependent epimerase/dehydratase family protein [Opitutales bacterium]
MKVLVTGGGGFVGHSIVERLLDRGYGVRAVGRSIQPDPAKPELETIRGDVADFDTLDAACADVDAVFHVAAKAGVWGDWHSYYRPNVLGTQNVVRACLKHGVGSLVYTSTPSVAFNRGPLRGVDETTPYGHGRLSNYVGTKILAEREALAAAGDSLRVLALRPHLVFGPGDPHLLPRVIRRYRAGRLRIIGDGSNRVDVSYIDDVADAHINALDALLGGRGSGKAYFISQGEPVCLWDWLNGIFKALGEQPLRRKIPLPLAYGAAALCEGAWKLASRTSEPPLTRFVAVELAKDHYFSIDAARRDLGYRPKVSMETAVERTVEDLKRRQL